MADAEDYLTEIASSIPPVDQEVFTLKHSAFLAQLIIEEEDLGETIPDWAPGHAVSSMRA